MRPSRSGPSGDLFFVVEHALGHAVHGLNLERALVDEPRFNGEVIHLGLNTRVPEIRLPVLGSWSFRASRAARRELIRRRVCERASALFVHTQAAALFCQQIMQGTPTVISMDATPVGYDSLGADYGHRSQARPIEWSKRQMYRRLFAAARGFVTWSRWAAESLIASYEVPEDKVQVIRPGIDRSVFRPPSRRHSGHRARLLFVGGDFVRKGGEDLIEALRLLGGRADLDIVTASAPAGPLDPNVTVHLGLAPRSGDLLRLYQAADIFVLPSRSECYGIAFTEAMACGLPVVGCRVGAVPELVVDGRNGMLVAPGRPRELAQALDLLIDRPSLRCQMGDAGLAAARVEHDASRNWHTIFNLMQQLADQYAPRLEEITG